MSISNEQRLLKWIKQQPPGHRFTVKALTGKLNMTSSYIGHCLKWFPGVKKGALLPGGAREWIVTDEASLWTE